VIEENCYCEFLINKHKTKYLISMCKSNIADR
jgi:hypothetical protein